MSNLPALKEVEDLLASLLGDDILVKPCEDAVTADGKVVRALYVNDQGSREKLVCCDLPFANGVGAALTRIPPREVQQACSAGEVPGNIYENLYEVLNICVNMFPADSHVVLGDVYKPGQNEDEIKVGESVTYEVDIPRYGLGKIGLAVLAEA